VFRADTVPLGDGDFLRPISGEHAEACFTSCQDPEIHRWLPLPQPYTRALAEEWCTREAEKFREAGLGIHFAICEGDSMVGCISFKNVRWREDVVEIGYWLDPRARGRGLATRAVTALVGVAFDAGFHRVELRIAEGNDLSLGVAQRAGFVYEGTLRTAGIIHGGRVDLRVFSFVKSDLVAPSRA